MGPGHGGDRPLKELRVEYNTLTLVNRLTADHPDEVFDFLIGLGIRYLQFIPCVEVDPQTGQIAEFSVTPKQYGDFQCRLFDRWMEFGPQRLSIRDFDSILSHCMSGHHTICTFDRQCSQYIVVEHTGDVFPCDFFVEPKWRLGNIFETPIEQLAACAQKKAFARQKQNLSNKCLVCRHLAVCRGGCMKDRAPWRASPPPSAAGIEGAQPTLRPRKLLLRKLPPVLRLRPAPLPAGGRTNPQRRPCQTPAIDLRYMRTCS